MDTHASICNERSVAVWQLCPYISDHAVFGQATLTAQRDARIFNFVLFSCTKVYPATDELCSHVANPGALWLCAKFSTSNRS